jgi:hypothetical protein
VGEGLETLVALLSSSKSLWEDAKLRLDKSLWTKLMVWIGNGGGRDLGFVLPLLATVPKDSCFGPSLPKFVDALTAAFVKAADANKVRALAAEVRERKEKGVSVKNSLKVLLCFFVLSHLAI